MVALRTQRTAAHGGVVLVLRFVAASVLNYGFGIALIWMLPKADFGDIGVLQNTLLLAAMVLGGGFPWVVARAEARAGAQGDDPRPAVRAALLGNLALGAVLVAIILISNLFSIADHPGLVVVLSSTVVVLSVNGVLNGALQGAQRFDAVAVQQTAEVATKVVLGLSVIVLFGLGVTGVVIGFLAGAVVACLLCLYALRDRLPGRGPVASRRTATLALPMGIGTSGFGLLVTLDVLALSAVGARSGVTATMIATYQAAAFVGRTPYYLAEALGDAAFPHIARSSGTSAAHDWFVAAFRYIPLALVPLQLVLVVAPEIVLRFFLPVAYADAANVLRLLTVGTLGLMASNMLFKSLYALGFAKAVARRVPLAAGLEVLALIVLVPRLGLAGAAIAFAVGSCTAAVLLAAVYLGHRPIETMPVQWMLRYAAAVAALVVVLGLADVLPPHLDIVAIIVAMGVYAAAVVRLKLVRESDLARVRPVVSVLRARTAELVRVSSRVRFAVVDQVRRPLWGVCAGVAFVATLFLWNLGTSPDTQYDEVVYTKAAQQVAQNWDLTWNGQALFVHPPLSFLAQASWLFLIGRAHADLPAAIDATRLLAGAAMMANIGLLALATSRLTTRAARWHRVVIVAVLIALAATDPILLRYGRLAVIEPFAVLACLLTLNLAVALREHPARSYLPLVGLATGLALLTNEICIFLLLTPLLHALLNRRWVRIEKVAAALAIGVAIWLLFPLWALRLGLLPSFMSDKASTLRRLLGLVQSSGWNRPGASFISAVVEQAPQYASSYVVLAGGGAALLWLMCHELNDRARWLLAFLLTSYGFAAYTVCLGTLNEQFFSYVLPAALVGTVLVADAIVTQAVTSARAAGGRSVRRLASMVLPAMAVLLVTGFALVNWGRYYLPGNDGLVRATAYLTSMTPACSAANATGDGEKFTFLLPGFTVTEYATGSAAQSHGVELFFLSDKDAELHYGNTTPRLSSWIRTHGVQIAVFPSATYRGVELWRVEPDPLDPLVGVESVVEGTFVLTEGSRCGGFPVVNGPGGNFASGWTDYGGKRSAGPPVTASWSANGQSFQVFDSAVLATIAPGNSQVRATPIVRELAARAPDEYKKANMPSLTAGRTTTQSVAGLLTDPAITATYLRGGSVLDSDAVDRAWSNFGPPLGPPELMPDGQVRQAFDSVVLEHRVGEGIARLAPVGSIALAAGVVIPASQARQALTPPPIPVDRTPDEPTTVKPFVESLVVTVSIMLLVTVMLRHRGLGRAIRKLRRASR